MNYKKLVEENPFAASKKLSVKVGGNDCYYGASSIEDFLGSISDLRYTHEDAEGFLDYPTKFNSANFWRKDSGVQVWMYEEPYDNWQNLYGMDAVMAFYHSGHGGMDDKTGVFYAPMGGVWDNRSWAYSTDMKFDERLRYLFWSTCLSLRVHDGHNPCRTWSKAVGGGGLRMMFGYETTSVDSKKYGSNFWDQWKKGKSFSAAFLDASWAISRNQTPVVAAYGSNSTEARSRLNDERYFTTQAALKGCCAYTWRESSRSRGLKAAKLVVPQNPDVLLLGQTAIEDAFLSKIANKIGITKRTSQSISVGSDGLRKIGTKNVAVFMDQTGTLQLQMAKANYRNGSQISESKASEIARGLIDDLGIAKDIKLTQSVTYNTFMGDTNLKTGKQSDAKVVETIIQFRQVNDKLESLNADSGYVAVSVDNDGKITRVTSSLKPIIDVQKPMKVKVPSKGKEEKVLSLDEQLAVKIERLKREVAGTGALKMGADDPKVTVQTISDEIGYDFSSNYAKPAQHREVEIKVGDFAKRYALKVDLE